jgi:hypothetical protein
MRIYYEQSGGFAGIVLNAVVDTKPLPADEVNKIQDLVNRANFFSLNSLPSQPGAEQIIFTTRSQSKWRIIKRGEKEAYFRNIRYSST